MVIGGVVTVFPQTFLLVLTANLWLLGYHHVVATFTRLVPGGHGLNGRFFLLLVLPVVVLSVVALVTWQLGGWAIATTYFYWQWFHYTRQSYGIARAYLRQANAMDHAHPILDRWGLYPLPLLGVLYRSYQDSGHFLGNDLVALPVNEWVLLCVGAVAAATLVVHASHWIGQARRGHRPLPYLLYVYTHYGVFTTGYLIIPDINAGWLVLNVWHNAQYILFVWHMNTKRFSGGPVSDWKWVSALSQPGKALPYFAACLGLTFVLYWSTDQVIRVVDPEQVLSLSLMFYMSINFHHYVVDAIIWRKPRTAKVSQRVV